MQAELQDYYRDLILDLSRRPHGRGALEGATHTGVARHEAKGDLMRVWLKMDDTGRIAVARFEGDGSAVALASGSLMTDAVCGLNRAEALALSGKVRAMLEAKGDGDFLDLGDLAALGGVGKFPARVACALLAWEALESALGPSGHVAG